MARTKKSVIENATEPDPQSKVSRYKTAEAEERAIIRRHRVIVAKIEKEMEGMTDQEKIDFINRRGREAAAKMGITKFVKQN
ncbi:MAG: hypothetical protein LBI12_03975 [Treponema sp.]|jgi:hypothetical protein|nr:hypothetical protein [Treponema sp.]